MKRVLILGAGGPAGINFARCLKGHYHTIGLDTSPYAIHFSCCDENYIGKKEEIIDKLKPHLIIAQPDPEVMWLGEQKKYKTFMPKLSTIKLCSSKKKTLDKLSKASLPSVITQIATSENAWTLLKKYHVIWIRANTGNAGRLHFKTDSIAEAEDYIDKHYKENLVVSPYIKGFNVGVDVIFHKGVCVKWFCRHRISYSLKEVDNESGGQSQITKVVNHIYRLSHQQWRSHRDRLDR